MVVLNTTSYHTMPDGRMMQGVKHIDPSTSLFSPLAATRMGQQPPENKPEEDLDTAELDALIKSYQQTLNANITTNNQMLKVKAQQDCHACVSKATS